MLRNLLTPARSAVLVLTLVVATACTSSDRAPAPAPTSPEASGSAPIPSPSAVPGGDCVVAAAGDVSGDDDVHTGAARTADLIASAEPEKVLALGDLAYDDGTAAEFADLYDPTWGKLKDITEPTPGNHEYESDGTGYFDYFDDVAPNYAFDVCGWHLISVDQYAGMSKAVDFITAEGTAAEDAPLLVYWHEPRFSSGEEHGTNPDLQPLWQAATEAGAEIVLTAHDHHYERFEPLDADGDPSADGTVQFVSGNGGHNLRDVKDREPHSEVTLAGTPGVLFLTLRSDGYDWSYRDVEGRTGDAGSRGLS
jgi:hypothetical protein